jgi:Bcr/CflA subfamily drug resistance transporter
MRKLLDKGLIDLKPDAYLNFLIIIAPLLNFLSGINVDLFTPSLPAISEYFAASSVAVKNTVTACMVGFALGCILFGPLMDAFGRRRVILLTLLAYIVASILSLFCTNIHQLIVLRFVQGMMVATVSIGPRAMIIDSFTGHRLQIGILYTSIAYALGPIIGPFIGGLLQYHFGWKANFIAYAFSALVLFMAFMLYINESLTLRQNFSLSRALTNYYQVIKHKGFIAGIIIGGAIQFEIMIYPTVGAFIVENIMHHTAITYGNSALAISCGALLGALANRSLIQKLHLHHLTTVGFVIMALGALLQIGFALWAPLNLLTLILPIAVMGFGNGFVFPNVLGQCLKLFPQSVGIAAAVFSCLLMLLGAVGVFIISHINVASLMNLAELFSVAIVLQLLVFFAVFKPSIRL